MKTNEKKNYENITINRDLNDIISITPLVVYS